MSTGLILLSLVTLAYAAPRGYGLSQFLKNSPAIVGGQATTGTRLVKELGKLLSNNVVGITTHPTDRQKLIYADETALYEFSKTTGTSTRVIGQSTMGLLADRSSIDGNESTARFKYITKIMSRPSGVYIFDYNILRKYNPIDKTVSTVSQLYDADWPERNPTTGVVSQDENSVYFTPVEGYGHFVTRVSLNNAASQESRVITAGASLLSAVEITADERFLLLADVDAKAIFKVNIEDGSSTQITEDGLELFYPGSMTLLNNNDLLVVNTEAKAIEKYELSSTRSQGRAICDRSCMSQITNPLDVAVDGDFMYALDGTPHPTLPTYIFSIKALRLSELQGNQQSLTRVPSRFMNRFG